ncbi:hypothetical protein CEW46_21270 [Bacillus cereus]|nr:hypothetical protein CEW46_21270 [Bacillus cereus]
MAWALINPRNNRVFKQSRDKYSLLKWGVQIKEHVSKRTLSKFKEGDTVTVVFTNTYMKWFSDGHKRGLPRNLYQDQVTEVEERQYVLREIITKCVKGGTKVYG